MGKPGPDLVREELVGLGLWDAADSRNPAQDATAALELLYEVLGRLDNWLYPPQVQLGLRDGRGPGWAATIEVRHMQAWYDGQESHQSFAGYSENRGEPQANLAWALTRACLDLGHWQAVQDSLEVAAEDELDNEMLSPWWE